MTSTQYTYSKSTGIITDIPIVLIPKYRTVACCHHKSVKLFDSETQKLRFNLYGHKKRITGLAADPITHTQVISCSLDSKVIIWDIIHGEQVKELVFDSPIEGFIVTKSREYLLLQRKEKAFNLIHYAGAGPHGLGNTIFRDCTNQITKCALGDNGSFAVALNDRKVELYKFQRTKYIRHDRQTMEAQRKVFTCVAAHPLEECIATGANNGEILIWRHIFSRKRLICTTLHWHHLAVVDMVFTGTGSHLLSGGKEAVLVKWDIGEGDQSAKTFLPRLGAPIRHITCAVDSDQYGVCLYDNSLLVVNSSFDHVFSHYTLLYRTFLRKGMDPFPCGLHECPQRMGESTVDCIMTNGRPGQLQFYDVIGEKPLAQLDVTSQNYVAPHRGKDLLYLEVMRVAMGVDWLVTYERLDPTEGLDWQARLRFWLWDAEKQSYQQEGHHELAYRSNVSCMTFRPTRVAETELLVSLEDGRLLLWRRIDLPRTDNDGLSCETSGKMAWHYDSIWDLTQELTRAPRHRVLLSFSPPEAHTDQLLAVAWGAKFIVCLWSDLNNDRFCPIARSHDNQPAKKGHSVIGQIDWANSSATRRYQLVVMHPLCFKAYDCVKIADQWELSLVTCVEEIGQVTAMAVHQHLGIVALATNDPKVHIFRELPSGELVRSQTLRVDLVLNKLTFAEGASLLVGSARKSHDLIVMETRATKEERLVKEENMEIDPDPLASLALQVARETPMDCEENGAVPWLEVETRFADYRTKMDERWRQIVRHSAQSAPAPETCLRELLKFDVAAFLKTDD